MGKRYLTPAVQTEIIERYKVATPRQKMANTRELAQLRRKASRINRDEGIYAKRGPKPRKA